MIHGLRGPRPRSMRTGSGGAPVARTARRHGFACLCLTCSGARPSVRIAEPNAEGRLPPRSLSAPRAVEGAPRSLETHARGHSYWQRAMAAREDAVVEPRRSHEGPRKDDRATGSGAGALDAPRNGGRALTRSERNWLIEQMASQRKRPVSPARSGNAGKPRPPDAAPPASAPRNPATVEPSDTAGREERPARRPPPATIGSFWNFG